jgi:tubulin polyglutamylase TTLL6/13
MIDDKLKPLLIEVNHTPSFVTDTPLDLQIKRNLILDSLILVNVKNKNKKK